jgi:transcriptional regulator with XRE-family HTH domain
MEFNEKLQELRKQKGMTQEDLAEALYVSRTAISKWESGRGYPNIDSLKAISKFFSVTIDELLSGEQILSIAEEENKQKEKHIRELVFGLLDICVALFLFLPIFAQKAEGVIREVSLLYLTAVSPYLKVIYLAFTAVIVLWGITSLALQNISKGFIVNNKSKISLVLSVIGALMFIVSLQPYAAIFLFVFLIIKVLMLIKW